MGTGRLERLAPLTGALFTVLFVIGFLSSGDTPDTDASGAEVISHYEDGGSIFVAIILLVIATVSFVFFASILREELRSTLGPPEWLASAVYAGAIIYAVALGIFAMSQFMLIDAADLNQPEVAQALNIFDNDNFFPAVIGLVVVYLAGGWHFLRSRMFPSWLAWVSLLLGFLALAGPIGFVSFLVFPLWVLVVSILLYKRQAPAPTAPAGSAAA